MPLMFVTYMLQYLDKITLGYTAVMGIQADTVRSIPKTGDITNSPPAFSRPAIFMVQQCLLLWIPRRFLPRFSRIRQVPTREIPLSRDFLLVHHPHVSRRCV